MLSFWFSALAFGTAALTGIVETLSRYRDEPFKALGTSLFGWFYVILNGALGLAAYYILLQQAPPGEVVDDVDFIKYALAAGFGAAVVIRSRVFTTKVGSHEVAIGPGYIVDQLLLILDRQIDRKRALERTQLVRTRMQDVDFQRVAGYVSTMILGSRQSMSLQDQEDMANQLKQIRDQPTGELEKAFALGFLILDFMGEEFLDEIFQQIDDLDLGGVRPARAPDDAAQAVDNADLVRSLLKDVPFDNARDRLEQAMAALESPLDDQQKSSLNNALQTIAVRSGSDQSKAFSLGFAVIDNAGRDFMRWAFVAR